MRCHCLLRGVTSAGPSFVSHICHSGGLTQGSLPVCWALSSLGQVRVLRKVANICLANTVSCVDILHLKQIAVHLSIGSCNFLPITGVCGWDQFSYV